VPETTGSRPRKDKCDGRIDKRQLIVAMVFFSLFRREGETYARMRATSCDGRRGYQLGQGSVWIESRPSDNLGEGDFCVPFPPRSGKTGVDEHMLTS
jgi:hypothetical protein